MATIENAPAPSDASMERLLTAVFMAISVPVAITDDELRFITANVRFLGSLGLTPQEIAGRRLTDFLIFPNPDALTKARAAQSVDGRPFDVGGRVARSDGVTGQKTARVEMVSQSGFKRIRVVTLLEPERPGASAIEDERLRAVVQATPAGQVIVAGAIRLIGLDDVRTALGNRWDNHAQRVMTIAERIIRRRMRPQDIVSRTDEQGFVVCFAGDSEEEASFRAAGIAREVREFLIGESDDPAAAAVSAVTRALLIGPGDGAEPESVLSSLEARLAAAQEQAIRLAEEDLERLLIEAKLEPVPLHDRNGKATPIAFAALPAALQGRLDVVAATLPPSRFSSLDTELLLLTLASEWGLAKAASIEKIAADSRHARVDVIIVPLDFAIFMTRRKQEAMNRICRNLPAAVHERLILSLRNMPRTITSSRLHEIVGQLKAFARGLALELRNAADMPSDLIQAKFVLVGIAAERLLDVEKTQSVRKLITHARAANVRLVARDAAVDQVPALTALGVDYHCLDPSPNAEPRKLRNASDKISESQNRFAAYQAAIDSGLNGFLVTDPTRPDNPIILANPAFCRMTGYSLEEVIGRNCRFLQGAGTDRAVIEEIRQAIKKGEAITRRLLNYRKDGKPFWVELTVAPVLSEDGRIANFIGLQTDVSAEQRAKSAHRQITSLFERVTETMPGFIYQRTMSPSGQFEVPFVSRSFLRLLGLPTNQAITPQFLKSRIHPADVAKVDDEVERSARNHTPISFEYRLVRSDGEVRWLHTHSTPLVEPNGRIVWNGVAVDITGQKTAEERLSYLGEFDTLTGLYNRPKYRSVLSELARETALDGRPLSLFAINVVRFHEINDTYGWEVGNRILLQIADRLKALFGPSATLFHLSGDEYAVVDCSIAARDEAAGKARDICAALGRKFIVDETKIRLQVNVGVSVNAEMGSAAEGPAGSDGIGRELEKRTELALHEARKIGAGAYYLHQANVDDRLRNRVMLQQSLHQAIEEEQFQLHYQPVVELASGRIVGAEALIRWSHPTFGMQRPDNFIPLAEESGLIVPLGAWVMRDAVRSLREWQSRGLAPIKVAVNVSGVQLLRDDLAALFDEVLAGGDIDPNRIELELTESALIHPSDHVIDVLRTIRERGVSIAIDDFGTGYASFQYLRDLPVNKLKIDQSFVRQLSPSSSDASIVRAIIELGRSMDLAVVVEGVETEMQRDFLVSEGCAVGQGYYFSPPLAEEDFVWVLKQGETLPLNGRAAAAA